MWYLATFDSPTFRRHFQDHWVVQPGPKIEVLPFVSQNCLYSEFKLNFNIRDIAKSFEEKLRDVPNL